jgi:serine/threonine protein phosphatase 1
MLSKFFHRPPRAPDGPEQPTAAVPPGTRLYVIGDVHGRADLLGELHQLIHEDAYQVQAPRNVAVYLGDYIDRGHDSRGVVELLLRCPLPGFERIHLKGNHEQALLGFLGDIGVGPDWLNFGGAATMRSYGVEPPAHMTDPEGLARAQGELLRALPREHLRFFEGLKLAHLEGDFLMVHAGLRPGVPIAQQREADLLWIRERFLWSEADFGKIVVHGHTIAERPEVRHNRIGIDTGAFHTGRLTCLVLQGAEYGFLQT